MTTYSAIAGSEIDADSPVTDTLMGKLTNNPLAVAEGDTSVPANLFPTVLLGTLTTTSGTTQTLSSLTLTPFKALRIVVKAVAHTTTSAIAMQLGGTNVTPTTVNVADTLSGTIWVDLTNSVVTGTCVVNSGTGAVVVFTGSYTTATTSISFAWSASGSFNGGSILVYGVK